MSPTMEDHMQRFVETHGRSRKEIVRKFAETMSSRAEYEIIRPELYNWVREGEVDIVAGILPLLLQNDNLFVFAKADAYFVMALTQTKSTAQSQSLQKSNEQVSFLLAGDSTDEYEDMVEEARELKDVIAEKLQKIMRDREIETSPKKQVSSTKSKIPFFGYRRGGGKAKNDTSTFRTPTIATKAKQMPPDIFSPAPGTGPYGRPDRRVGSRSMIDGRISTLLPLTPAQAPFGRGGLPPIKKVMIDDTQVPKPPHMLRAYHNARMTITPGAVERQAAALLEKARDHYADNEEEEFMAVITRLEGALTALSGGLVLLR